MISLGEGSTPLLPSPRLSERLGVELWLKWEAANPTGSYKDRGMTVAVSKAAEEGAEAISAPRPGTRPRPPRRTQPGRAFRPRADSARRGGRAEGRADEDARGEVLEVRGDFDDALAAARELADRGTHVLVNSVNPNRRAGQKTAVFEIVEELGGPPDAIRHPLRRRWQHLRLRAGSRSSGSRPRSCPWRRSTGPRRWPRRSGSATPCTPRACARRARP